MSSENKNSMVAYASTNFYSFEEKGFCEVDSMILCWLSYLKFHKEPIIDNEGRIWLRDTLRAEDFPEMFSEVFSPEQTEQLLFALAASPRFRNIRILKICEERNDENGIQFAAMAFELTKDLVYVAYRGTDFSLTGWKEDFRLSLKDPIPSQKLAVEYLSEIAKITAARILIGGHSKGGNLAVYAAANCGGEIQKRILTIFNHDGPGVSESDWNQEGFQNIRSRIQKTVPKFSVFGLLFEQEGNTKVVESTQIGIMQHDLMTWVVKDSQIAEAQELSRGAELLSKRVNRWIKGLDYQQRSMFIETLFCILATTKADSVDKLINDFQQTITVLFQAIHDLDPGMKRFMRQIIWMLLTGEGVDAEDE